ncbi:MAG: hypothetical protein HY807_01590 [Nitrospirae bacterium]|nr:hypothetical protein [Nitrospirota bacterium]
MSIVYIECLSPFSLLSVLMHKERYSRVFYFNAFPRTAAIASVLTKIGLLRSEPEKMDFPLADVRDEDGGSRYMGILGEITEICESIGRKELDSNRIISGFEKQFDREAVTLFFKKIIAEEIMETAIFINMALSHSGSALSEAGRATFLLKKNLWSGYLQDYAAGFGLNTGAYRSISFPLQKKYLDTAVKKLSVLLKVFKPNKARPARQGIKRAEKKSMLIASSYTGRQVVFDLKRRSEFFWMLRSDIPHERVLTYFEKTHLPATQDIVDSLKKEGLKFISLSKEAATSKEASVWSSTPEAKKNINHLTRSLIASYLHALARMEIIPLFYLNKMGYFIYKYSYWHDLFRANKVKIHINSSVSSQSGIPAALALKDCGGVAVTYQYSNFHRPSVFQSIYSDVYFLFGPEYRAIYNEGNSVIRNIVYSGYVTDYAMKEVKEDALSQRKKLLDKGADFIITFFDENSSDDRMSLIPNKRSAYIYRRLLELVIGDRTLGLICAPKFPYTLFNRMPEISGLMDKAVETGRARLISGHPQTESYPAENAMAADLCVGSLVGGTTALESYLSGTRTVILDLEKLYSNSIYDWGKGKAVFDDIDELFSAIGRYRKDPASMPGFGDLSAWVKDKDPFRDGNASYRIGQYIGRLVNAFDNGKTGDEAIAYANNEYADEWGGESVVPLHR